ncbi:MAG: hypothetical protein ABR556_02040, partial [Pyrinomonadaceae bacterium]
RVATIEFALTSGVATRRYTSSTFPGLKGRAKFTPTLCVETNCSEPPKVYRTFVAKLTHYPLHAAMTSLSRFRY